MKYLIIVFLIFHFLYNENFFSLPINPFRKEFNNSLKQLTLTVANSNLYRFIVMKKEKKNYLIIFIYFFRKNNKKSIKNIFLFLFI